MSDTSVTESGAVPIPRTLETPPRTTGIVQNDLPILIDWFYRAYQVITQSVAYINSQVNNPDFSVADLPDPSNTTLAQAQQTAIRQDYGMDEAGLAEITVRKSMLYYTLKRLGLDTDPAARRPQDQQIILANAAEVFAQIGRAEA